jgi:ABC-type polysaccharide/polyol phosphate export permease
MKSLRLALRDIKLTISQTRVWLHLGWVEVKQRYRRSIIGPWWISISMLIFILMMGLVFSRLFKQQIQEYVLFFASGFIFWSFISSSIIESTELFKSNSGFIKQINLPFSLYICKHLVRNCIILMHNFVVFFLICAFFKIIPKPSILLVIPGLFLIVLNMYWICLLIALISARFRDMVPLVNSCIQIAFFVTPISWMPKLLDPSSLILRANPLVYMLDIVRSPLMGAIPSIQSWIFVIIMTLVGGGMSFLIFSKVRVRIPFWVD